MLTGPVRRSPARQEPAPCAAPPLRRDGKAIGVLVVYRDRRAPFTDEELALQQSFADQAAIATENSRLFNETREALERQTATAEILKVIASSPSDVQPVFDAIVTSAARLIGGFSAGVYRFVDDLVHLAAFTSINPAGDEMLRASFPRPIADIQTFERVRAGEVVPITDTEAQPAQHLKDLGRARGFRSVLNVPLNSHGTSIGMIVVSRTNPGPFAAHHVELLQAFADQAVIAIENVRLFNETREALERQTATAEILKVIASSPRTCSRCSTRSRLAPTVCLAASPARCSASSTAWLTWRPSRRRRRKQTKSCS